MIAFYGLDFTYYDHPNKYSLVLYCGGCNFKCYGCHNRQLAGWDYDDIQTKAQKHMVDYNEFADKLKSDETKMALENGLLDMVILCGGELLIYPIEDILESIDYIKSINPNVLIRVDTNGSFPEKTKILAESGKVDGFAIDIKGPYWDERYHDITTQVIGLPDKVAKQLYPKMVQSLEISKQLPYTIYRTVVYPIASDDYFKEIKQYVSSTLKKPHHFSNFVNL